MTPWDEQIAARTLWAEARGEPMDGIRAVAHTFWNRVRDGRKFLGNGTLASVCLLRKQFSCWNHDDPQRDRMAVLSDEDVKPFLDVVQKAQYGVDPTGGALYYFSDSMREPPSWAAKMKFLCKIGHHSFFTDKGGSV